VKEDDVNLLKKVWWFDCNPPERKVKNGKPIKYPAADGPSEINATPVFWKNRVYVAVGQDPEHGEGVGNLTCIDATKTGDITKTGKIWSYNKINRSISTVSITPDGLLFINDFSGFIYCLDAETGKEHWIHDAKAHMWGSTLVADGKVYAGDEDGDVVVLAASKEKKVLRELNLDAPVYSTPIVANGTLYIASNTHLYAIGDGAKPSLTEHRVERHVE
jgi:outer membrane protein assembly factor BamB